MLVWNDLCPFLYPTVLILIQSDMDRTTMLLMQMMYCTLLVFCCVCVWVRVRVSEQWSVRSEFHLPTDTHKLTSSFMLLRSTIVYVFWLMRVWFSACLSAVTTLSHIMKSRSDASTLLSSAYATKSSARSPTTWIVPGGSIRRWTQALPAFCGQTLAIARAERQRRPMTSRPGTSRPTVLYAHAGLRNLGLAWCTACRMHDTNTINSSFLAADDGK